MKRKLLIRPFLVCTLFFLISLATFAQNTEPQRGDNVVLISTTDSLPVAFRKLQLILQDNGYSIEKQDKELWSLQTDNAPLPGTYMKMYVTAYIREREGGIRDIYLQGKYSVASGLVTGAEVSGFAQFTGMGTGGNKAGFRQLEKLGRAYEGAWVYYTKK